MLGNLFGKQQHTNSFTNTSSDNAYDDNKPKFNYNNITLSTKTINSPPLNPTFIHSDEATTTWLYRSRNIPAPPYRLHDKAKHFRLLILQDAGVNSKNVLFDTAYNQCASNSQSQSQFFVNPKPQAQSHHSINDLTSFVFGSHGLPTNEMNSSTKFQYLHPLPSNHSSVLISRIFCLDPSFENIDGSKSSSESDWPITPSVKFNDAPKTNKNITKFAIALVIPIPSSLKTAQDIITDHWPEIQDQLANIQNTLSLKLKLLNNNLINNRKYQLHQFPNDPSKTFSPRRSNKFHFQPYLLQADPDLSQCFTNFLNILISLTETPRLFAPLNELDNELIGWAYGVRFWLEVRDGRYYPAAAESTLADPPTKVPGLKFLATLLSILVPIRDTILLKPMDRTKKQTTRIVISTLNPIVSQKLILIIAGVLGFDYFTYFNADLDTRATTSKGSSLHSKEIEIPPVKPVPILRRTSDVKPSPFSGSPTLFFGSGPGSGSGSGSGSVSGSVSGFGWEIPSKATPVTNHSPVFRNMDAVIVKPERISLPKLQRTSSYASLQNLSSSFGSHSTASSSWRIGSFLERFRNSSSNSFIGSNGNSGNAPSPTFGTTTAGGLDVSPPIINEGDEYPWRPPSTGSGGLAVSTTRRGLSKAISMAEFSTSERVPSHSIASLSLSNNPSTLDRLTSTSVVNYVSINAKGVPRTSTKIKILKFDSISSSCDEQISKLMNAKLNYNLVENESFEVLSVDQLDSLDNSPHGRVKQLPLMTGYTEQYKPEFSLMSCSPQHNLDSKMVDSMKDDVLKMGKGSKSKCFFINLKHREIKLLEVNYPTSPKSKSSSPNNSTMKPLSEIDTNSIKPRVTKIFSPGQLRQQFKSSTFSLGLANSSDGVYINNSLIEDYDKKLNRIVQITQYIDKQLEIKRTQEKQQQRSSELRFPKPPLSSATTTSNNIDSTPTVTTDLLTNDFNKNSKFSPGAESNKTSTGDNNGPSGDETETANALNDSQETRSTASTIRLDREIDDDFFESLIETECLKIRSVLKEMLSEAEV